MRVCFAALPRVAPFDTMFGSGVFVASVGRRDDSQVAFGNVPGGAIGGSDAAIAARARTKLSDEPVLQGSEHAR